MSQAGWFKYTIYSHCRVLRVPGSSPGLFPGPIIIVLGPPLILRR